MKNRKKNSRTHVKKHKKNRRRKKGSEQKRNALKYQEENDNTGGQGDPSEKSKSLQQVGL